MFAYTSGYPIAYLETTVGAAVNEPEEWSMMLLGSSLMALQTRSKRRKAALAG